jgi:hypothetical protein
MRGFAVVTAILSVILVFCHVTLRRWLNGLRRFEGTYRLRLPSVSGPTQRTESSSI